MTSLERRLAVRAFACLVLGAIAMGASPIFVRLTDVGPQASAFWRTFLALPFLWLWARLESNGTPGPQLPGAVWLAGLLFAGDLFFWHLSILATSVANATFLATTAPIWVALGAGLVLAEKIGARTLAGLLLCLAGGGALIGQSLGFAPHRVIGDVYGLVTALFFGCYMLAVRAARLHVGAGRLAFLSTSISAACLFAVALALEGNLLPQSTGSLAALVALAVVSQVGGQGLLAVALGTLPATFSSLVIFLEAIAAAGLAWILLDEPLGLVQIFGGMLILFGIWIARPRTVQAIGP
jgi:drug/metabolite transporter (DMT)-like permease